MKSTIYRNRKKVRKRIKAVDKTLKVSRNLFFLNIVTRIPLKIGVKIIDIIKNDSGNILIIELAMVIIFLVILLCVL